MQRENFLSNLLYQLKFMAMNLISQLGLLKLDSVSDLSSEEDEQTCPTTYVFLMQNPPGLVTVSMDRLIAHIKRKLPVSPLGQLRRGPSGDCTICLEGLDEGHEVRELLHCDHVFHKECLDCWVDHGQVTCPLCRSMLFSTQGSGVLREIHGT